MTTTLGPTGEFPDGRLNPDDEGELRYVVGTRDGKVVVDFGSPVVWIGMGPQAAVQLAQALIRHARTVSSEPLTVEL